MTPAELLLSLILTGVTSHYEHPTILDDKRLEHLLLAGKQILYKSHQESDVRQALGFSSKIWGGLTSVFAAAILVLESKSFARLQRDNNADQDLDGVAADATSSSSDLIASNYLSLVKDIERLNDLCTIARNLLATTKRAQNLAAEQGFDQQILALINVCVRVTARGFDGEGGNVRSEERWGKVVNLYKRLLITCLQFLHNFIMHNEQRKLVLWLDLFGAAAKGKDVEIEPAQARIAGVEANPDQQLDEFQRGNGAQGASEQEIMQRQQMQLQGKNVDIEVTIEGGAVPESEQEVRDRVSLAMERLKDVAQGTIKPSDMSVGLGYSIDDVHALFEMMSTVNDGKGSLGQVQDNAKVLMEKIRTDMERLSGLDSTTLDGHPDAMLKVGAALRAQMPNKELPPSVEQAIKNAAVHLEGGRRQWKGVPDLSGFASIRGGSDEILDQDLQMPRSAQSAAETLQEAKDELMARLQDPPSHLDDGDEIYDDDATATGYVEDGPESGDELSEEEDDLDEEVSEDDDDASSYRPANDQERGLLTDVPLVLGPTEIEALPMIIQAGIVDNFGSNTKNTPQHTAQERQNIRNMQSVRCHILLAQEAGRNVLRELLIFIAAWDLPDDEFYFKMMVQIMESILKNGLMSHAYADFGQAKDIISPAQAVVVKILTHIYRGRYSPASAQADKNKNRQDIADMTALRQLKPPAPLTRIDVLTVRYIFTVFRGNIVPETCALIYLQGQIRQGLALAEDFPLNLWDMERVYEGVYQFLEFFAVLTENNDWNRLLVDWEIVYDLVTLIKELEHAIPKVNPLTVGKNARATDTVAAGERDVGAVYTGEAAQMAAPSSMPPPPKDPLPTPSNLNNSGAPMQVERPYSLSPSPPPLSSNVSMSGNGAAAQHQPTATTPPPAPPTQQQQQQNIPEDPSTFPWRNLKKLIILVLSSLVWKSRHVQDQIRETGGVDVVLNCTVHDANNPYIREHAVMCLKFLLEGNVENQRLVAELEREKEGGQGHSTWDRDREGWVGGYNKGTQDNLDVAGKNGVKARAVSEGGVARGVVGSVGVQPVIGGGSAAVGTGRVAPATVMDESVFEDVD